MTCVDCNETWQTELDALVCIIEEVNISFHVADDKRNVRVQVIYASEDLNDIQENTFLRRVPLHTFLGPPHQHEISRRERERERERGRGYDLH
jgi:hypothetical protein